MMAFIFLTVERIGDVTIHQCRKLAELAGMLGAIFSTGIRLGQWRRTVRAALARQILSAGVESIAIICFLALSLGVLVVVEYQAWVGKYVQTQLLPAVLVVVVVRELGPLLVNFVAIGRNGNAITTELGIMQVSGETRVLEGLGVDPFVYLVLPRVCGLVISVCCLTTVFIGVTFLGAYVCGQWVGAKTGPLADFVHDCLGAINSADLVNLLLKSTVPPALAGSICCMEGLNVAHGVENVPRAAMHAVERSVVLLFISCAVISVFTYL